MTSGDSTFVTAWDCREDAWWKDREAKTAWLDEQGLPARYMYRAEFYDMPPRAIVFCYAADAEGRRHFTHAPGDCTPEEHGPHCVAREEPRELALTALPPEGLR